MKPGMSNYFFGGGSHNQPEYFLQNQFQKGNFREMGDIKGPKYENKMNMNLFPNPLNNNSSNSYISKDMKLKMNAYQGDSQKQYFLNQNMTNMSNMPNMSNLGGMNQYNNQETQYNNKNSQFYEKENEDEDEPPHVQLNVNNRKKLNPQEQFYQSNNAKNFRENEQMKNEINNYSMNPNQKNLGSYYDNQNDNYSYNTLNVNNAEFIPKKSKLL